MAAQTLDARALVAQARAELVPPPSYVDEETNERTPHSYGVHEGWEAALDALEAEVAKLVAASPSPSLPDSGERERRGDLTLTDGDGDALKLSETDDGRLIAKTVHAGRPDSTRVFLSIADQDRLARFLAPVSSSDGGEREAPEVLGWSERVAELESEIRRMRRIRDKYGEPAILRDERDDARRERGQARRRVVELEQIVAASSSPPAGGEGDDERARSKRVPLHETDRRYVLVPDAPDASMLDVAQLPANVRVALREARDHEAQGAAWPTLLADPVRAWFRYHDRAAAPPVSSVGEGRRARLVLDAKDRWMGRALAAERQITALVAAAVEALHAPDQTGEGRERYETAAYRDGWFAGVGELAAALTGEHPDFAPGEGRDAPAREGREQWRVVENTGYWSAHEGAHGVEGHARERAAVLDAERPSCAPHRVQRRMVTKWVDVPACEDGGDDGDR